MRKIMAALVLSVACGFIVYLTMPDLIKDLRYRDSYVLSPVLKVQSAKCRRYVFLVSSCTVRYTDMTRPDVAGRVETMGFGNWDGERVRMVQSSRDPGKISFELAAERVYGRLTFLLLWSIGSLAIVAALIRSILAGRRAEAPAAIPPRHLPSGLAQPSAVASAPSTIPAPPLQPSPVLRPQYGAAPPAAGFGKRGLVR